MNQNVLVGLVLVAVLGIGGALITKDNVVTVNSPVTVEAPAQSYGVASGPDQSFLASFFGGIIYGNNRATTTPASMTLAAADLLYYDSVAMYPDVGDVTITFPASSTLKALVPKAGQIARQCWYNATTTSGIDITFASGTGVDLEIASTTTGGGAITLVLNADNSACFEFQRKGGSGT